MGGLMKWFISRNRITWAIYLVEMIQLSYPVIDTRINTFQAPFLNPGSFIQVSWSTNSSSIDLAWVAHLPLTNREQGTKIYSPTKTAHIGE